MNHSRVYWLTYLFLILVAGVASATSIVLPTDDQLIAKSPVIIEGTVLSTAPIQQGSEIWTETKLAISRTIKGNVSGAITVREIGGEIGDHITKVFGTPEFTTGERVLLFLTPTPRGDYQTTDLFVGKFSEQLAMNGRRLFTRDSDMANVQLLDAEFRPVRARTVQRDAETFEAYVSARAAGRTANANYAVENPVMAKDIPQMHTPEIIVDNFTMISEPTIYRWFAFDRGSSAQWYSSGTQPGYSGGGVNEIQTAMSAWNTVSGAKINYTYVGVENGAPAGLSAANGVNEVLFNDPLNEISGSWNPSTGGVVGQGGFNGVAQGGTFTATFNADATHTSGSHRAYEITEANLTIQDNVAPGAGISSTRLAEIVAHEFGHTLGLGHSTDSTALMYPTVTGLGPAPRTDDQRAVQWLYPSGGTAPAPSPAPTAPAAPTNLRGTVSGSSINLAWTRNSTNEAGFYIYLNYNGTGFTRVSGSFSAGSTGGTVTSMADGNYQMYISAFNSSGESTGSNVISFSVSTAPAQTVSAYFTVSPSSGIAGQTVFSFFDQSSGGVTARTWNFGDGTVSTAQNPTHVYGAAGQYIVTLNATNGTTNAQYTAAVNVAAPTPATPPVAADFAFSPAGPVAGSAVTFIDASTGAPTQWAWNFGDGYTTNQQSPTHTYASAGAYTVTLSVSNGLTTSSRARTLFVAASTELTLNNSRYKVTINARDQRTGKTAVGRASVQTGEFGYFSLPELTGDPNNPEVFVKVLGPVNGVPWVFFGGLTDVEYSLYVTDTVTGQTRQYYHAPGDAKGGYDTGTGQLPAGGCVANLIADGRTSLSRATATSTQLALMNSRFALTLTATDPRTGARASGITIPKNDESGFYTLPGLTNDANNVEVFVKIVNATSVDGHYWIFFGGLTDFQYTLTVTDTGTGKVRSYTKPAGSACGGFDTTNF